MNIYKNITTNKQYKASTGFSKEEFMSLFLIFEKLYFPKKKNIYKGVPKPALTNKREALFFILHYLKAYPTLVNMGIYFGFSESTASIYIELLKPILKVQTIGLSHSTTKYAFCFQKGNIRSWWLGWEQRSSQRTT